MSVASIKNPGKVVCTMQFTMSLDDWKQIRATLNKNAAYTELQIIEEINDLVYKLESTLYADPDRPGKN